MFKLIVICLVATGAFSREDKPSHNAVQATHSENRRPKEYLQPPPPPPPRAVTPTAQRRAPTRLHSVRINGHHSPPLPAANVRYSSPPPTGNGLKVRSTSDNFSSTNSASVRHGPPLGSTPASFSADGQTSGSTGNSMSGVSSPPSGQRISRWFFSSGDSEVQGERKPGTNEILRPPPPPPRSHSVPPNYQPLQSPRDQTPSGTHHQHSAVSYHGASPHHKSKTRGCNPCNKVPWIPMIRAHDNVPYQDSSHAVSSHDHNPNIYQTHAPVSQYDSPSAGSLNLQTHGTGYDKPLHTLPLGDHYGPPPPSKLTDGKYAIPPLSSIHPGSAYAPPDKPTDEYGPPLSVSQHIQSEYKQPPLPIPQYVGIEYGPPPKPIDEYGPPPPPSQHIQSTYNPSSLSINQHTGTEYRPPHKPQDEYGPPPPLIQDVRNEYKPPHLHTLPLQGTQYAPPSQSSLREPEYQPPLPPQSPGIQYGTPSRPPDSDYRPPLSSADQYGPPQHDTIKQSSSPQLAPSYLPAPPVYESGRFKDETHSSVPNYLVPSPTHGNNNAIIYGQNNHQNNAGGSDVRETGGVGDHSEIDVDQSISLEDSHAVASQHPVTSGSRDVAYTSVSSIHLVPGDFTTPKINNEEWNKEVTERPPVNGLNLPSGENYQPREQEKQLYNPPTRNNTQNSGGLEVIPSIQVADYLSSVEYPLQIVQSPYIDVTEPPGHSFKQNNKHDKNAPTHTPSYDKSEIIIGKPALAASNLNDTNIKNSYSNVGFFIRSNTSEIHDQKQQQTTIHETNSGEFIDGGPITLDHLPVSGVLHSSSGNTYFASDNQINHSTDGINVLGAHGSKQGLSVSKEHDSTVLDIQPSIQTSAESNSLIHQINNAFQSHSGPTTVPPIQNDYKQSQNSDYILFQNFPRPPLSYLPTDVLKQQLPPPTPLQSTFQQNPYLPPFQSQSHIFLQSTPQPLTTISFERPLKLEAPALFLNPPPKNKGEHSTVTNLPLPEYSFWTPTSRPLSSSLVPVNDGNIWGSATTHTPLKLSNENIIAAFAEAAGLLPPPPSLSETLNQSDKNTKQIQIIVPYTSSKELMQFKIQDTNKPVFDTTGWLPITGKEDATKQQGRKAPPLHLDCSDDEQSWQTQCKHSNSLPEQEQSDYHQHQESRTATATAPAVQSVKETTEAYSPKSYSEMQQIFAINIRDLLRGEEDKKTVPDSITLQRLQKNIDEWTALEYSKKKDFAIFGTTESTAGGRKSTTAHTSSGTLIQHLLVPSKKIPEEYLTTTPSQFDDVTSTENSVATAIPSFKRSTSTITTSTTTSTTTPLSPIYDHVTSGSNKHTVSLDSNKSSESESALRINRDNPVNRQKKGENHRWNIIESNYIIPEAVTLTTEKTTSTTTPPTTTPSSEEVTDVYTNTGHTTWDQIPLSISPITNEKVYVVTPMATWRPEFTTATPYRTPLYSTDAHTTSINDVFPFRNGPPSAQKLVASTPFLFQSPRFIVRPTPGTTVQRAYTVMSTDDEDDNWNDVKATTLEPVNQNEINGNAGKIEMEC